MKWLIHLFPHSLASKYLTPGSQINTPKGKGTVINGMVTVRLDKPWYAKNRTPQSAQSFNLEELTK